MSQTKTMNTTISTLSTINTIDQCAQKLGYTFKEISKLEQALIHKSFGNEQRAHISIDQRDNERLEFLGDAVLDLSISLLLIEQFPLLPEGDLSKLRAGLVNERSLAHTARQLGLGEFIILGKGEDQTGGRDKDSILSSTFEAIVAAVYLDGGFQASNLWIRTLFEEKVKQSPLEDSLQDYKTRLQEIVQARYKVAPKYEVVRASGPDHEKTFEVRLLVHDKFMSMGHGKSKKEAEQDAARVALEKMTQP